MTTNTTALLALSTRLVSIDCWDCETEVIEIAHELAAIASQAPTDAEVLREALTRIVDFAGNSYTPIYTAVKLRGIARAALAATASVVKRSCAVSGSSWGLNCDETLSWGTHDKECALYNAKDEELPLPTATPPNVSNATEPFLCASPEPVKKTEESMQDDTPDTPEEAAMFDIGRNAWAGVPDNWVSEIRGHEADATPGQSAQEWNVVTPAKEHSHITCAKYPDLLDFHLGIAGEGPHAYTWSDKPHRLVYDLTHMVSGLRDLINATPQPTKPEADAGSTQEKTMIERIRAQSALAHTFMPYVQVVGLAEVEEVFFATDAQAGQGEALGDEVRNTLAGIAFANRRNKDVFDDDAAFVDWAQSIAKHVINKRAPPPARSSDDAENDGVCGVVPGPHNWSIPQANGLLECLWCGLFKTARNRGTAEGGK